MQRVKLRRLRGRGRGCGPTARPMAGRPTRSSRLRREPVPHLPPTQPQTPRPKLPDPNSHTSPAPDRTSQFAPPRSASAGAAPPAGTPAAAGVAGEVCGGGCGSSSRRAASRRSRRSSLCLPLDRAHTPQPHACVSCSTLLSSWRATGSSCSRPVRNTPQLVRSGVSSPVRVKRSEAGCGHGMRARALGRTTGRAGGSSLRWPRWRQESP